MTQWYVKELSKIADVSVQTLHHYDKIGLLKPSVRLTNGYRLYSEKDLLKLQQITALKFFGFKLESIKVFISENVSIFDHFSLQAQFLKEKAKNLLDASKILEGIISECGNDKSLNFKTILKSMEVYKMTQKLEHTWAGKVLTPEELKQYANFEQSLEERIDEKQNFETTWNNFIEKIKLNLNLDPKSNFGTEIAKQIMDLVNGFYSKDNAELKHIVWHKGFKGGHSNLDPKVVTWLDTAIDTYYRSRIYKMLDQVGVSNDDKISEQWHNLLTEMYGNSQTLKDDLIKVAIEDNRVSNVAKNWLINHRK